MGVSGFDGRRIGDRDSRSSNALAARRRRGLRRQLTIEALEERALLSVSATVTPDGVFQVASDASDAMAIQSDAGQVKINGQNPQTGPFSCADVTAITVAAGPGGSVIDLERVVPVDFPALKSVQVEGGAGDDRLIGPDLAALWFLTGPDSGSLGGPALDPYFSIRFDSIENLVGAPEADDFVFSDGATLSGTIDGGGGENALDFGDVRTDLTVALSGSDSLGFAGTATGIGGSFSHISRIAGGAGSSNRLIGEDVDSAWMLDQNPTYADGQATLAFSAFGQFQGGSGADTFHLIGDTLGDVTAVIDGGAGDDQFLFEGIAILTGSIDGQGGHNTLSYADFGSSVNVQITGSDPNGYQGAEASTFSGGGFQGIDNIIASPSAAGTSILTGDDSPSTWDLGATQTYSDGSVTPLSFSGFAILQGGAGVDTFNVQVNTTANLNGGAGANAFVFSAGVTLTGSIAGGAGTDTLDLSAYTTTLSATLTGSDATGLTGTVGPVTGTFTGINVLIAGSGTNTLTGESVSGTPSTWNLSGTKTYNDGTATLTFSGFGTLDGGSDGNTFNILAAISSSLNLKGGAGNDSFIFSNGVTLNGKIDGQGGINTINYSAYTRPVTVNLGTAMSTGTLGIGNIQTLVGTTHANTTLVGPNAVTTWTISEVNGGSLTSGFTFHSVQNLSGGVLANTFSLGDGKSVSGAITGGSTNDTLDLSYSTTPATVNVTNNNAGNVQISNSTVLNFSRIANVKGTTGNDTFVLSNGKGLTGFLNGDGGADTLSYSAYTTSVRVNLSTGVAGSIYGGVSGIENVTGGTANDILIGDGGANTLDGGTGGNDILVGLGGNDTLTVQGAGRNILIGGDGTDKLNASTATGENLLIGGKVVFGSSETNLVALNSLMAEWSRTGVSFATRRAHLNGTLAGGLNGSYKLITTTGGTQTVFGDSTSAGDTLTGNPSGTVNTWFIAYSYDHTHHDTVSGHSGRTDWFGPGPHP